MSQLLVDVTPFKPVIRESKEKPGVFEVEGILQRAVEKIKTEEHIVKRF